MPDPLMDLLVILPLVVLAVWLNTQGAKKRPSVWRDEGVRRFRRRARWLRKSR